MRTIEHYIYLCEGQIEKKILEIFILYIPKKMIVLLEHRLCILRKDL